ncbi:MAG: capsid protein [Wigfec virus K19_562]|nr:MAG: capsid protein [Wigfec virus K19_562]
MAKRSRLSAFGSRRGRGRRLFKKRRVQKVQVVKPRAASRIRLYRTLGQPKRKTVIMPYSTNVSLTSVVPGASQNYVMRANSIFDPDVTGAGHQPLSHDQWALFYNHYVVTYCTVTCEWINANAPGTAMYPQAIGIQINDDVNTLITGGAGISTALENKHIRYRFVPRTDKAEADSRTWKVKYRFSPLKFANRSKYSQDVRAAMGNNPTEQVMIHVFAAPLSAADTVGTWYVNIHVAYTVELSEPKELTQS